ERAEPGRAQQPYRRLPPAELRPPGQVLLDRSVRRQVQHGRAPPTYREPDLTVYIGQPGRGPWLPRRRAGLGAPPLEPVPVQVAGDDRVAVRVDQYFHRMASATACGSARPNRSCSARRTAQ